MKKIVLFLALSVIYTSCASTKNDNTKSKDNTKSEKAIPQKTTSAKPNYEEK